MKTTAPSLPRRALTTATATKRRTALTIILAIILTTVMTYEWFAIPRLVLTVTGSLVLPLLLLLLPLLAIAAPVFLIVFVPVFLIVRSIRDRIEDTAFAPTAGAPGASPAAYETPEYPAAVPQMDPSDAAARAALLREHPEFEHALDAFYDGQH